MIGIYKITNPKGKIYIGQSKDISLRFKDYFKLNHCKSQPKLYYSLKKYGPENHIFEIIEECSIEQLDEREIYWIKYYKSFKDGLNLTEGGEGCKGFKRSKEMNVKHSLKMIGKTKTSLQKEKISLSLTGKIRSKDFGKKISLKMKKNIPKKDKIYKNPEHYLAGKERPEWVKEKIKEGMARNKKPKSKETIEKMKNSRKTIPILQYDLNDNFIKEWKSQTEAAKFYELNSTGIMCCCKGKQKTAGGFKWKYKNI